MGPAFFAYPAVIHSVAPTRLSVDTALQKHRIGQGDQGIAVGRGKFSMRRLISMTAFGFGFYYLWYNTDPTIDLISIGAMGVAILLEFAAPD